MDSGVKSRLSKFADDAKLEGKLDSSVGSDQIQENRDTFIDWAEDLQIQISITKYQVLGSDKNNENRNYMMHGTVLERVIQEKDLGVVIDMGVSRRHSAGQL